MHCGAKPFMLKTQIAVTVVRKDDGASTRMLLEPGSYVTLAGAFSNVGLDGTTNKTLADADVVYGALNASSDAASRLHVVPTGMAETSKYV